MSRLIGRGPRARWLLFSGLAVAVVVVDQLSKAYVDANYPLASLRGEGAGLAAPTPVVDGVVRIAKTYNSGGLFGLFGSTAPLLALGSVAVIGFILVYHARSARSGPLVLTLALGLLLGGALGNLADRLRFGHVVDFVDMGIGDLRWYTFNVADAAISTAIVVLLVLGVLGDRLERHQAPADVPSAGA